MTEHDTIIVTQPDSATFWAWVHCDSLGHVLIEEINAERGRRTLREYLAAVAVFLAGAAAGCILKTLRR